MKKQPNKKTIGAFILAGIIAFLVIIAIALGLGLRGGARNMYVMYFHESIKGLSVGAPVVLNGVEVGKVAKIEIVPNPDTYEFTIPVYITFNDISRIVPLSIDQADWSEKEIITRMIERGLHGRLVNQNLLTGQLMIELDVRPAKTKMTFGPASEIPEIPTALSSLGEISANVQDIPVREVVENLNQTLLELKDVISPAAKVSNDLSKKSAATLNNFNQAVQDISRAANAIRNLADYLEQHPEALIKGK
ncbi:MAG: MlaD family protein [Alphaproteobacteria bacterium]|nr:MlaD family protein [Alphaproteobacteria bacterium]